MEEGVNMGRGGVEAHIVRESVKCLVVAKACIVGTFLKQCVDI